MYAFCMYVKCVKYLWLYVSVYCISPHTRIMPLCVESIGTTIVLKPYKIHMLSFKSKAGD